MKATLKKRITGQLKFLGFMAIALWMVAVTGCKKHEILEPRSRAHCEKGEDKDYSANQRLGVYSTDSEEDEPRANLRTGSSDNNRPMDDMITDGDGNDDDGDDEDGDNKPVTDKDGNNDDEDGENNRITDKDSSDNDSDGEGIKGGRN